MAPDPKTFSYRNRLLNGLSAEDLSLLEPGFTRVDLALRERLEEPNRPIKHALFMESGLASIVAIGNGGRRSEVGIVGSEGMTAVMVVLGNDRSPNETFIQLAGAAMRIASDDLRRAMAASASLHQRLLLYGQTLLIQTSHTALANSRGTLEERLARWLLMAHDRTDGNELPLVHEFLALMLGVRRPGVTVAIQALESRGLIGSSRARIVVLDRKGLERTAKGLYGLPEAEYDRLMGPR
jgi:CRP-like cAMP-binding protein